MSKNSMLGVIGGALIAISVFLSGDTATFNAGALSGGEAIVLFVAGILVIIFMIMGNRTWAAYAAIAATTLLIVQIVDGGLSITVGFIILVVGVILALIASVIGKK